jgi:hypothetical protein
MNGKEAPLGFVKEESCRISFFNEAAQLIRKEILTQQTSKWMGSPSYSPVEKGWI